MKNLRNEFEKKNIYMKHRGGKFTKKAKNCA